MGDTDRERGDGGQYVEVVTLADVRTVFTDRSDPSEPLTAREVADALGCNRKTAYNKLRTLAGRDVLETKKVGARGRVWWLVNDADADPGIDAESAADRVGGHGLFTGEAGEALADAIEASRNEFGRDYEDRHDDLFGQ